MHLANGNTPGAELLGGTPRLTSADGRLLTTLIRTSAVLISPT